MTLDAFLGLNEPKPDSDDGVWTSAAAPESVKAVAIPGDGIGPELMEAVHRILKAAGAPIDWQECEAGAGAVAQGKRSGLPQETLDAIAATGRVLKGPLATGIGTGAKSVNVTLRKHFELYANVRPARMLPGIVSPFAGRNIDLVVVRENVEDLYAGIEHMQTPDVAQCLKLITRHGSQKIADAAFAVARSEGRKRVTCASKANIMKLTEGMFKKAFEEAATKHPDITADHMLIDNLAHKLVIEPEAFDVIAASNMNGDIISDLTAGLVGGLGLAPSANLGARMAMFEAVHGSAPDIAEQGIANPTALLLAAVMMLRHAGKTGVAERVEHALYATMEEGHELTPDLARPRGLAPASTSAFADRVISNLGRRSQYCPASRHAPLVLPEPPATTGPEAEQVDAGIDVFIQWKGAAEDLPQILNSVVKGLPFRLVMISNRGLKVYPGPVPEASMVDHWRCRFAVFPSDADMSIAAVTGLITRISNVARWCHVERLQMLDGEPGFSLAQGQ